jgi:hypothetical protein
MSWCCKPECKEERVAPWYLCPAHIVEMHHAWLKGHPLQAVTAKPDKPLNGDGPVDEKRANEMLAERIRRAACAR